MADYASDFGVGSTNPNSPDARGSAHNAQATDVSLCRDVYAGTRRMREKRTLYLPKFEREDPKDYDARLGCAVLYNAFARTVGGLSGMIMRVDPELSNDVSPALKSAWENIDLQGNHGAPFTLSVLADAIIDGHAHMFIDLQEAPGAKNLAEERAAGLRPYWRKLRKQEVIRFSSETVNGETRLTRLAFTEKVCVPKGAYGDEEITRIREYRRSIDGVSPVAFEIYEKQKTKDGEKWVSVKQGSLTPVTEIPLATVYADPHHGFMVSSPPLLDLAYENILHYQTRSDRQNTLHICGVPIPVFIGLQEGKKKVGAQHGIALPINGDAKYLEPAGAALEASRAELQDIEQRMASLGLAMLQRQTRAAETAEAKTLDKNEQDSALASIARSLQDCLEQAAGFHARWLGEKGDAGGSININQDFEGYTLDPQTIQTYLQLVREEVISLETMWRMMVEGNALPEDFDPKKEKALLAKQHAESMAEMAAMGLPAPGAPPVDPNDPKAKPDPNAPPPPKKPGE